MSFTVGAGKTTLATALGKVLNVPVYYEPVIDNEYLADFYTNPAKYSFALQVRWEMSFSPGHLTSSRFIC